MSNKGFSAIIIIILVAILALAGGLIYFYFFKNSPNNFVTQPAISENPLPTIQPSASPELQFTIDLPQGGILDDTNNPIRVQTTAQFKDLIEGYKDSGCPGVCSEFVEDPQLVEDQFTILTQVAQVKSPECALPTSLTQKIQSRFRMFAVAIEGKEQIKGIHNPNLAICGFRYVGADGYDAALSNYRYKVGFIKDDNIIQISYELFPFKGFPKVEKMWESFGYKGGSCDGDCYEKEVKYLQNINLNDPMIQEVIKDYDKSVASLKPI